jgi:hypothetical protein
VRSRDAVFQGLSDQKKDLYLNLEEGMLIYNYYLYVLVGASLPFAETS